MERQNPTCISALLSNCLELPSCPFSLAGALQVTILVMVASNLLFAASTTGDPSSCNNSLLHHCAVIKTIYKRLKLSRLHAGSVLHMSALRIADQI